nr:MAG TPA: hypothetical protein [Caudoviricetes sp.]
MQYFDYKIIEIYYILLDNITKIDYNIIIN